MPGTHLLAASARIYLMAQEESGTTLILRELDDPKSEIF